MCLFYIFKSILLPVEEENVLMEMLRLVFVTTIFLKPEV